MLNRRKEAIFEWKKALKHETNINEIKKIKEKIRNMTIYYKISAPAKLNLNLFVKDKSELVNSFSRE